MGLLDIRIFGFDATAVYPAQAVILSQLDVVQDKNTKRALLTYFCEKQDCRLLRTAVDIGCHASLEFYLDYLKKNVSKSNYQRYLNYRPRGRMTALHVAALLDREAAVKVLIAAGADVHARDWEIQRLILRIISR
jgi:ankyrin repeat protein